MVEVVVVGCEGVVGLGMLVGGVVVLSWVEVWIGGMVYCVLSCVMCVEFEWLL